MDFQTENAGYYTQRELKLHDQGKILFVLQEIEIEIDNIYTNVKILM